MSTPYAKLPAWAEYGLIPLINLAVAFMIAGLVVLFVGENPLEAAGHPRDQGAFGRGEGIGYTLFYATNFIFTGLAVAVAIPCRAVQHRRRRPGLYRRHRRGDWSAFDRQGRALVHHVFRSRSPAHPCSARSGR
jgi:hypothetical protein